MEKLKAWRIIIFVLPFISVGFCHSTVLNPGACVIRYRILNVGDTFEPRKCFVLTCRNSTLTRGDMDPKDCPEPPCDPAEAISQPGRCCKVCPGTRARCWFNGMTVEDGETFQLHPCGSCNCQDKKLTCDKACRCPDELGKSGPGPDVQTCLSRTNITLK